MAAYDWDDDYDFDYDDGVDFSTDPDFDFEWAKIERLIEEQRLDDELAEIEACELRANMRLPEFDASYEAYWRSVTPGERHKAKDRLIPLGKWWHSWKRGLLQKKETLRTHRDSRALRKGKRCIYAQKQEARGAFSIQLECGEGPRIYAHTYAYMRLV